MPYWNRHAELYRSLVAYDRLYPDIDWDVSIADDGSLIAPEIPAYLRDWVTVASLPRKPIAKNPCVPINVAIENAKHDIIVLTNPEIEHRERVLDRMLDAFTGPNDYVMTGCRDTRKGDWYAGPETPRAPIGGRAPIPAGTELHFCVMFHRSLWIRAGGFDEEYRDGHAYDDNDWLFRLWSLGDVNFKYVPGVVWHCKDAKARSLWRPEQLKRNAELFRKKWGHTEEYRRCAL